jgi:hypothetical protein
MIHLVLVASLQLSARPDLAAVYKAARTYDKTSFRFRPPTALALAQTRALVAHLMAALRPGAPPRALAREAAAAGFELVEGRDAAGALWILREPEGQRAGAGLYAFRAGGAPIAIQAPHTFFDEGTGEIALALFARLHAGALFCNTVHRYAPSSSAPEAPDAPDHAADVAHAEATHFAHAHQGLLDAARWAIVQVHGFGDRQGLPAEVKAVVADGGSARAADAPAVRLRAALAARWGAGRARLYGVDADVLGATTNVEGKAARRAGAVFLHMEMSAATRKALATDAAPLADALHETLRATDR